MGITARGAWESVKRHFRELGHDIQRAGLHGRRHRRHVGRRVRQRDAAVASTSGWSPPSTTATSSSTPTPNAAASFAERSRLFELPRSSWDRLRPRADLGRRRRLPAHRQVDPAVARGARGARRRGRGADAQRADPRARCARRSTCCGTAASAPTSRRASETHADVGDKANDAVRVDAARAALPGGRRGRQPRPDAARRGSSTRCAGGRVNTDAIDNSAGVDCSDHEVNIKILLDGAVADGDLTVKQRNELLVEMTDAVAELVLQGQLRAERDAGAGRGAGGRACSTCTRASSSALEPAGRLDRELEALPERRGDRRAQAATSAA